MANLCDRAECQRLADNAWEVWKGLDVCVNNAGADTLTGEAARWPFERKLEELLAVDVTATMLLSRALGQRMKEAGGGVVINMGWDQADVGMEGDSGELFAAAKGAVMAFSKSLALSLAPRSAQFIAWRPVGFARPGVQGRRKRGKSECCAKRRCDVGVCRRMWRRRCDGWRRRRRAISRGK